MVGCACATFRTVIEEHKFWILVAEFVQVGVMFLYKLQLVLACCNGEMNGQNREGIHQNVERFTERNAGLNLRTVIFAKEARTFCNGCADNTQSYACDIELFGRKRGSGESIWDIKRHIGYVSPEMHRAYLKDLPAIDIVASGLNDSVGLYVHPRPEQRAVCEWWMDIFGIAGLKDRTFLKLSSGEQRLCLLARAFVKDPELLILDEPLHGLDDRNRQLTREIISAFCRRKDKTMIMVTHYAEELPDVITHNLFLKKNK